MRIELLEISNFRNLRSIRLEPGPGLNILAGENAQGKTAILEAVWYLATTRSFRTSKDAEAIRHGAEEATIAAEVRRDQREDVLLGLRLAASERKQTRVNGVLRTRAFDLVGQLLAVFFGSGELDIVAGEPSARRRFLDLSLSQVWPKYCLDLAHYKRVLEHRNRLLKEIRERPRADSGLDAWNEQLARYGAPMMERRKEFLERLAPKAAKHHFDISQKREELRVTYRPNVPVADLGTADGTAASFLDEIERRTAEEVTRGTTLVGPHRDDLELLIGSEGARAFGSQGQKRTVALALKLAELELMQEVAGEPPVLLLDDVFSDLDGQRRRSLLENAAGRCQTFLTCTSTRSLSEEILSGAHVFEVQGGSVAARE